tara:strand:- start:3474 stop:3986 length:513 start_codon:yes stop_codon:yes gene_type:complete
MTQQFDPYVTLGLAFGVTDEEIKTQYRKLVKELHPDKNPSPHAREKFEQVMKAYRLLSDPDKKREFDTQRQRSLFGQQQGTSPFNSPFFDNLKNFASRVAHDFIDDLTNEEDDIDPSLFQICDTSVKSTRKYHEIKIRIPTENMDIFKENGDYWIDQLCLYVSKSISDKV